MSAQGGVNPRALAKAGQTPIEQLFKRGRDTVLARSPALQHRAPLPGSPGRTAARATLETLSLTPEQRLLLQFVDGRLSIARVARLAGLAEDVAAEVLRTMCEQGVLLAVEPVEVTIRGQQGGAIIKLGPYEIAAQVGQGGMGSVYVCRRIGAAGFRRLFALKVIRQHSGQEDVASQAFVREIAVGRLLTHPNLQSVIDVGMYADQHYLVLDYIEGTDLDELLTFAVPPGVLVTILVDLLRGLQAAHETTDERGRHVGLVHGDISPPNILIGLDGLARLADFGNARFTALGEIGWDGSPVAGKPAFMAPEQFLRQPLDRRTDIFALGVVMWTALTGKSLFAADTLDQIVQNVLERPILPPSSFGAPPCLDAVCLTALQRNPAERYASADDMLVHLMRTAVSNGHYASPAQVAEYVRGQLGDKLAARQQRIDLGFRHIPSPDAPVPVTVSTSAPLAIAAPAAPKRTVPPTVVLPVPGARPQPRTAAQPGGSRARRRLVGVALAIALIVAGFLGAALGDRARSPASSSHRTITPVAERP